MPYATRDNDGHVIRENAYIRFFETDKEAQEWLAEAIDLESFREDDSASFIVYEHGGFSDCWIRLHRDPFTDGLLGYVVTEISRPLTYEGVPVSLNPPGDHPGGREWWITPKVDVLIALVRCSPFGATQ